MNQDTLRQLFETIVARKSASTENSYTAQLLAAGPAKAGRKLAEEAVEALIAAMSGSDEELTSEAADVLYHLLVLLASRDIDLQHVYDELEKRTSLSGLAEKAGRPVS